MKTIYLVFLIILSASAEDKKPSTAASISAEQKLTAKQMELAFMKMQIQWLVFRNQLSDICTGANMLLDDNLDCVARPIKTPSVGEPKPVPEKK